MKPNTNKIISILKNEAPDIPLELIQEMEWELIRLPISKISIDKEMWESHRTDPIHQNRFQTLRDFYLSGKTLPPVILMHHNHWLVDGYTRIRVLLDVGIVETIAILGKMGDKETIYSQNEVKISDVISNSI